MRLAGGTPARGQRLRRLPPGQHARRHRYNRYNLVCACVPPSSPSSEPGIASRCCVHGDVPGATGEAAASSVSPPAAIFVSPALTAPIYANERRGVKMPAGTSSISPVHIPFSLSLSLSPSLSLSLLSLPSQRRLTRGWPVQTSTSFGFGCGCAEVAYVQRVHGGHEDGACWIKEDHR
jgi:hypothetical protein